MCLHRMINEYPVFLEDLSFPSFFRLVEAARRLNESVKRTLKPSSASHSNLMVRPFRSKRPIVATVENDQETRPLNRTMPLQVAL